MTSSEGSYSTLSPSHMETMCFPSIPQTFASKFASKFKKIAVYPESFQWFGSGVNSFAIFSWSRTEELKDNKERRRNANKNHTLWANLGTVDASEIR